MEAINIVSLLVSFFYRLVTANIFVIFLISDNHKGIELSFSN